MNKTVITLAVMGMCMTAESAMASSPVGTPPIDVQIDQHGKLTITGATLSSFDERLQLASSSNSPVKNVGCGYHCRSAPAEGQA